MKLLILIFIIAIILSACATTNNATSVAFPTSLVLSTSGQANQSGNNTNQPIAITVYQLKQNAQFQQSDFISLVNNPSAALGDDYVSTATYILKPNSSQTITITPNPSTQYLGIVAQYQNYQGKNWRWSTNLADIKKGATVRIGSNGITKTN